MRNNNCCPSMPYLGSLLFNTFINDIFLFLERSNICNFAADNALFEFGKTFDEVIRNHFWILTNVILWLLQHLLIQTSFKCKNIIIKNSASENLLDVIIDNKLDFTMHLKKLYEKANLKLHVLKAKVSLQIWIIKERVLCKIHTKFKRSLV